MKALLSKSVGGPETLVVEDMPDPQPGPGQVRMAVKACGVNYPDLLIIQDRYQFKPERPFAPGGEVSGVVEAVGPGVTTLKVGDRVIGSCGWGGMATKLVLEEDRCIPFPDAMPFEVASALILTYGTTIHALKDRAKLMAGETLAVLGAAGGTGLAAIEIGKLMGARVIACASSDEKCAFAKRHGADETINYGSGDLRAELKRLGGAHGIDVVYDPVGDKYAEPALRSMAWEGRYLVIGFAAGDIPKIPLNLVLLKSCDIVGVHWGAFVEREPEKEAANMAQIVRWCAEGRLSAHVHAVYPLAETAQALKDIAARKIMGKAILKP